jgi:hypothetical protein
VEVAVGKRHTPGSRWEERVVAAEREWQKSGWERHAVPTWLEVLSHHEGPGWLSISGRLVPEGEPPIPLAAHAPPTGLPLLRAHAYRMFRDAGHSFDDACRFAACFELDGWVPDGPATLRYRQLREVSTFGRSVTAARKLLRSARAALRRRPATSMPGGASPAVHDEFRDAMAPRDDARSPHGHQRMQNRDQAQLPPGHGDVPDRRAISTRVKRMEWILRLNKLAAQVEAALKTVPKHGVGIPPFPFDGKHRLVIRDRKMVVEEVLLRTSLDECQDEAETHLYVRSLPLPSPCERTCMDGRAMPGLHGHCANCNEAVPAFAVVQFFDGSLPIPRFCCSDRCRTAIFEALRKEHEGGGCDRG